MENYKCGRILRKKAAPINIYHFYRNIHVEIKMSPENSARLRKGLIFQLVAQETDF